MDAARAHELPAGVAEQLTELAQRIFPIDEVAMRTSDERKGAPQETISRLEQTIHQFQLEWMIADKRVLKWVSLGMETGGFEKCAANERAPMHGLLDKFYRAMNAAMPLLSESLRRDVLKLARIFEKATEPRSFWSECGDETLVREVRLLLSAEAESIGRPPNKSPTEPSVEPDEPQPAKTGEGKPVVASNMKPEGETYIIESAGRKCDLSSHIRQFRIFRRLERRPDQWIDITDEWSGSVIESTTVSGEVKRLRANLRKAGMTELAERIRQKTIDGEGLCFRMTSAP